MITEAELRPTAATPIAGGAPFGLDTVDVDHPSTIRRADPFRRLWLATAVSSLGDGFLVVALPLLAASCSRHPLSIAAVAVAERVPLLAVGLPAGALADRVDRARAFAIVNAVRAAVLAGLAAIVAVERVSIPLLVLAALCLGTAETLYSALTMSAVPTLVGDDHLNRANGRLFATQAIGEQLVGTALGAILFAAVAALPLALDALTFAAAGAILFALRQPLARPPAPVTTSLRSDVLDGLHYFRQHSLMRVLSVVVGGFAFCQALALSVLVLFALETLGVGQAAFGLLLAAGACGSVAAGLLAERVTTRLGPAMTISAGAAVAATVYLGLATTSTALVAGPLLAVETFAVGCAIVATLGLRQSAVDAAVRGRVANIFRMLIGAAAPLGGVAGGALAAVLGLRAPLIAAGALQIVLVAATARRLDDRLTPGRLEAHPTQLATSARWPKLADQRTACGDPLAGLIAALGDRAEKRYRAGTDRVISPEDTLRRVTPHLATMGITRVARVDGLDHLGVPVYCAMRPLSRNLAVSQGKGLSPVSAQVSAVMESLEMWHAQHHALPTRWATTAQLRAETATCAVESMRRYRPEEPLDEHRHLRWVEAFDLLGHRRAWVPYEAVHCDGRAPRAAGEGVFARGSNGLASGNHHLEAVLHALYEIVERDAITDWRADPWSTPGRIDLETVDDPECLELLARFRRGGVEPIVWSLPSAVGLPTFGCYLLESRDEWIHPLPQEAGSGTHACRNIALSRALTEAAQARVTVIAGSRDDIPRADFELLFDPEVRDCIADLAHVPITSTYHEAPDVGSTALVDDLRVVVDGLRAAGFDEALVVDLTRPEIGIPVVKAIVPGARFPE